MEKTHDEEMAIDLWELISAHEKAGADYFGGVSAWRCCGRCIYKTLHHPDVYGDIIDACDNTGNNAYVYCGPSAWKRSYGRLQYSCDKPERS